MTRVRRRTRPLSEAPEVKFSSTAKTWMRGIRATLKVVVPAVVLTVGLSMATTVQAGVIYLDVGVMQNARGVNIAGIGNASAAPMQFKARYEDGRKVDLVAWCVDVYHSITVKDYNPDLKYRDDGTLTNDFSALAKPLESGDVLKVGLLTHYGYDVFNDKPVAPPAFVTPKPTRSQYPSGAAGTAAFNAANAAYNSARTSYNTALALYNTRVSTRNTRLSAVQSAIWQVMSNRNVTSLNHDLAFDLLVDNLSGNHLTNYFAAALMMPYARFLRACEGTGYDIELLQRRFGAGFEQVAHRLTTLQRVGARGLPFFMIRIDRAGQSSKRFAGASGSPLVEGDSRCPLWALHQAFDRPGKLVVQLVELEDGDRWFTLSRTVRPQGVSIGSVAAEYAIGLGIAVDVAAPLASTRGIDLKRGEAVPIGLGCRMCTRPDCPQRSAPPVSRALVFNERERGIAPFIFAGD